MNLVRKYWLAIVVCALLLVCLAVTCAVPFAAQGPIASPPRIAELIIRPATGLDGAFLAFSVEAKLVAIEYSPSGSVDAKLLGTLSFDLVKTHGNVTIDGESLDDKEAMDHLAAIVLREWGRANPPPLPMTRRARRTQ